MNTKTILLTGARSFAALDMARMFSNAGHIVILADCIEAPLSSFSKKVKRYYKVASPADQFLAFTKDIGQIVKDEAIDIVIPSCEEIFYLSKIKNQLSAPIFCMPFESLDLLHNKWSFFNLLKTLHFKTPETLIWNGQNLTDGKWIIKPIYSRFASKVHVVEEKLPTFKNDPVNMLIAQRYIEGEKFCSYSVCHQGKITAHGVYKVLHAMGIGSSICFESVENRQIDQFIEQFVSNIQFTGQIAFDFIQENELYCIECNPRATSGVHLFERNENLAECFFSCKNILKPEVNTIFHEHLFMLWYGFKQKEIFSKSFWKHFFKGKNPLWDKTDKRLLLKLPLVLFSTFKATYLKKKSFNEAMTEGIEYNGELL